MIMSNKSMEAFREYSDWVEKKIVSDPTDRLHENVHGICAEAGEVAGKIQKSLRDNTEVTPNEIIKELGDLVYYATALANYYNANLGVVILENLNKLDSREARGTIKGSGDNR